jgi:small subunit ribosomal protein S1
VDDPWKSVKDKYKVGDKVTGKVLKIESFGLMVGLDRDIHGLAHISELSDEPINNLGDTFKIGQEIEFEIVSLEPADHRLGLKIAGVKGKSGRKASEKKTAEASEEKEVKKPAKKAVKDEEKA